MSLLVEIVSTRVSLLWFSSQHSGTDIRYSQRLFFKEKNNTHSISYVFIYSVLKRQFLVYNYLILTWNKRRKLHSYYILKMFLVLQCFEYVLERYVIQPGKLKQKFNSTQKLPLLCFYAYFIKYRQAYAHCLVLMYFKKFPCTKVNMCSELFVNYTPGHL